MLFEVPPSPFVRLYAFLAQIRPFQDEELEKLFAYLRFLLKKLPRINSGERLELGELATLKRTFLNKPTDIKVI
jgi:type I restriction enzyme R subunit